jgi:hypothetical protein
MSEADELDKLVGGHGVPLEDPVLVKWSKGVKPLYLGPANSSRLFACFMCWHDETKENFIWAVGWGADKAMALDECRKNMITQRMKQIVWLPPGT